MGLVSSKVINGKKPSFVVVVARHGERQDYVERDAGGNWVQSAQRPWDPPLSDHGLEQGYELGKHLAKELDRLDFPPIVGIYTSPLLRCRQTAAQARKGILYASNRKEGKKDSVEPPRRVRIETGLVESINENWYRSWACKGSNGTWGFGGLREGYTTSATDSATLHQRSLEPIQGILSQWTSNWTPTEDDGDEKTYIQNHFDLNYESLTKIDEPYTFLPRNLESDSTQRERMRQAVTSVTLQDHQQEGKSPGTILFLSHGAPVTHLFEELTGRLRLEHGTSSYCCYSIYRIDRDTLIESVKQENENKCAYWEAVQVNQARYLNEKIVREEHI